MNSLINHPMISLFWNAFPFNWWTPYILIVIACFLLYGNTLQNDYSLDDHFVIENNSKTAKGIKGIPEIFASHYIENKNQSYGYRPVTLATFAIEYEFFGANPFISHLINLLLYVATCLVLYLILKRIFREYHCLTYCDYILCSPYPLPIYKNNIREDSRR